MSATSSARLGLGEPARDLVEEEQRAGRWPARAPSSSRLRSRSVSEPASRFALAAEPGALEDSATAARRQPLAQAAAEACAATSRFSNTVMPPKGCGI